MKLRTKDEEAHGLNINTGITDGHGDAFPLDPIYSSYNLLDTENGEPFTAMGRQKPELNYPKMMQFSPL
ncbi:hypothetical protein C5167_011895 [Papaver somniferum]|uniref:Uncharacterized protein n=1 Tax=Papaver somniferum TaxID=3469 RepID=A0A4Y7IZ22_PAPSO|nr:hypothetical protein C5167_011895 [Papaver somniferum]